LEILYSLIYSLWVLGVASHFYLGLQINDSPFFFVFVVMGLKDHALTRQMYHNLSHDPIPLPFFFVHLFVFFCYNLVFVTFFLLLSLMYRVLFLFALLCFVLVAFKIWIRWLMAFYLSYLFLSHTFPPITALDIFIFITIHFQILLISILMLFKTVLIYLSNEHFSHLFLVITFFLLTSLFPLWPESLLCVTQSFKMWWNLLYDSAQGKLQWLF
jgi:hypothetical protein